MLDLKGHYRGTPVDVDTDPELYRQVAEAFPEAYLEDPDVNDETRPLLEPPGRSRHLGRAAALAGRHQGPGMDPKAINSKPSRFGSLQEILAIYEYCDQGIKIYGGGQGEVEVGRAADPVPRLALPPRHPERHRALRLQRSGGALGPADGADGPGPSATGFRWGE